MAKKKGNKQVKAGGNVTTITPSTPNKFKFNTGGSAKGKTPIVQVGSEVENDDPLVVFSEEAHAVICEIQYSGRSQEVSWMMATTRPTPNEVHVHKIFVPEQECTGTNTNFGPDAFGDMMQEWTQEYDGAQVGEMLNAWFHLHPNGMGVGPSPRDEDQMSDFMEEFPNVSFWLRGIVNGKGERKLDLYFPEEGYAFANVDWVVDRSQHQEQVDRVMGQIKERAKAPVYNHTARQGNLPMGKSQTHSPTGGTKSGNNSRGGSSTHPKSSIYDFEATGILGDIVYMVNNKNGLEYAVMVDDDGKLIVTTIDGSRFVKFSPEGERLCENEYWAYFDATTEGPTDATLN